MTINGKLSPSMLTELKPYGKLRTDAALAYEQMRIVLKLYGISLRPSSAGDAYREWIRQDTLFRANYTTTRPAKLPTGIGAVKNYARQTWYRRPGKATAAVPGTSNHGWGIACDFADLGGFSAKNFKTLAKYAGKFGWSNKEGKSIGEYWHWVFLTGTNRKAASTYKAKIAKATVGSKSASVYSRRKSGKKYKVGSVAVGTVGTVIVTWGAWAYLEDLGWIKKSKIKKVK